MAAGRAAALAQAAVVRCTGAYCQCCTVNSTATLRSDFACKNSDTPPIAPLHQPRAGPCTRSVQDKVPTLATASVCETSSRDGTRTIARGRFGGAGACRLSV